MVRRVIAMLGRWAAPARAGALVACAVYVALLFAGAIPLEVDAHSYWAANAANPYTGSGIGIYGQDAYFYSPAFTQGLSVLHALPWPIFAGFWAIATIGCLLWVTGRWFGWAVIVPFVAIELAMGNIHVVMAAMIVAGFRFPALWAFMILTKVTPGVGVLWFAFRREWRSLVIALGATAVIAFASFTIAPALWGQWFDVLLGTNASAVAPATPFDLIPRAIRLALAVGLIAWAARTDRRWVVPVAATLALPVVYINGLAILVAAPVLWARDRARNGAEPEDRHPVADLLPAGA